MQNAVVVNVHHQPYDVYIGRSGRGYEGPWGNPFALRPGMPRGTTIERYRRHLWAQVQDGSVTKEALAELHGKRLGCFCAPAPCHGDVLARAAAWAYNQINTDRR